MTDLKKISNIYFIGIGGIGMSALARYFLSGGVSVSGYDKTRTSLTAELEKEGMRIHYEDDIELLDKEAQVIVYTPAIPKEHKEFNFYLQHNYQLLKRSDVLEKVTENTFNICVAGTHGKTTISTMIAHILRDSGYGCNAFLGGISTNYHTNFWGSQKNVCVVEADEYDRSFLKLEPDVAVISAMDADHLDIYGTEDAMQNAFVEFTGKIKAGGLLISKQGLKKEEQFKPAHQIHYSLQDDGAGVFASNITTLNGSYRFNVVASGWTIENLVLNMGGMHNIENAVAAITVAQHLQIDPVKIKTAVENFKGVKRRFEYIIPPSPEGGIVFIDDYAHHPEELKALLTGARSLFNDKKCIVIFQPHLFTRTRDFAKEFAQILDMTDEVILLPIYPARELPIEGVTSELILHEMRNDNKSLKAKEELLEYIKNLKVGQGLEGVLITAGAGDIDALVQPLKQIIQNG